MPEKAALEEHCVKGEPFLDTLVVHWPEKHKAELRGGKRSFRQQLRSASETCTGCTEKRAATQLLGGVIIIMKFLCFSNFLIRGARRYGILGVLIYSEPTKKLGVL